MAAAQAAAPAAKPSPRPSTTQPQDTALGKVTVRARNRLEPLQEVPLSISVVTGKELDRLQATDIGAITQRASNVSWNLGNQRTSSLSIRGVGRQGQTEAQDPSVGFIVDGVSYGYNALTSSFDFIDVDTVEVTRGPQGTLLGKNASLGVVSVNTRRPCFTPDASWSVTYGDWTPSSRAPPAAARSSTASSPGAAPSTPTRARATSRTNTTATHVDQQGSRLRPRAAAVHAHRDVQRATRRSMRTPRGGETTNARTFNTPTPAFYSNGAPNPLSTDASTRLARRWFTQHRQLHLPGQTTCTAAATTRSTTTMRVRSSPAAMAPRCSSTGTSRALDLTSISAYKDYHFQAVNDEGTPFDVYRNAGGFWNDYKQWSQEFRVNGNIGESSNYQTGSTT